MKTSKKTDKNKILRKYSEAISLSPDFEYGFPDENNIEDKNKKMSKLTISDCTEMIKSNPGDYGAYLSRAILYTNIKNFDYAIADYTEIIRNFPDEDYAYINRGVLYMAKGYFSHLAILKNSTIEKCIISDNTNECYKFRGISYGNKYFYEQAIADFTTAITLNDCLIFLAYENRALSYENMGDYNHAISDYTLAIQDAPDYKSLYYYRADVYKKNGNLNHAIADYTTLIHITSNNVKLYYSRSEAYFLKGDYSLAIADLETILKINPNNNYTKAIIEII